MTEANTKTLGTLLAALVVFSAVFAGLPAGVAAASGNTTLSGSGSIYWQGQTLTVNAPASASGHKAVLRTADASNQLVSEYHVGNNSQFTLDTTNLNGKYNLTFGNTSTTYTFEVAKQTLSVNATSGTSASNGNTGNTVQYKMSSNRAGYPLNVSSQSLTVSQLENVLGWGSATASVSSNANGASVVTYNGMSRGTYSLNMSGVSAGDYTVNFAVPNTTATASLTVHVTKQGSASATFSNSVYQQQTGDVAKFVVNLHNAQTAQIQFGGSNVGYSANATVTDQNNDSQVTVLFNTAVAGQSNPFMTPAKSKDTVTLQNQTTLSSPPLSATSYGLSASVNGRMTDVSSVDLTHGSVQGMTIGTLPGNTQINGVSDLQNASPSHTVATGDKLVVAIHASGFQFALGSATDLSHANMGANNGAYLNLTQAQAPMNSQPNHINVSNGTVYADSANDTYYVVFNSNQFGSAVHTGDQYNANFVIGDSNPLVQSGHTQSASGSFTVAKRTASFSNEQNGVVQVSANQSSGMATVSGSTTVAAGTQLTVTAESTGSNPFLKSQTVTVQNNQFSANFNFNGVSAGSNFTVQVNGLTDKTNAVLHTQSSTTQTTTTTNTTNTTTTQTTTTQPTTTQPTTTQSTSPSPTTTQPTTTQTHQTSSTKSTSTSGQPGFTAGLGIVAALGAAFIAFRRN